MIYYKKSDRKFNLVTSHLSFNIMKKTSNSCFNNYKCMFVICAQITENVTLYYATRFRKLFSRAKKLEPGSSIAILYK